MEKLFSLQLLFLVALFGCTDNEDAIGNNKLSFTTDSSNAETIDTSGTISLENEVVCYIRSSAGMVNEDGSEHKEHSPNVCSGRQINVTDPKYGADPEDNDSDDTPAIKKAISVAEPGDEVYFPDGVYNLRSAWKEGDKCNIRLASGVNMRGESLLGTLLRSYLNYSEEENIKYHVILASGVNNIHMLNFTITSSWQSEYSTNPAVQNPYMGGPAYVISTISSNSNMSYNLTFENISAQKFAKAAFSIGCGSHDVVVKWCSASNATDVGGGGRGYGFVLQGKSGGHGDINPYLNSDRDNYHNVITNCVAKGPYIRHGILLQYYAHNNLVRCNSIYNTAYGAIDLHGEDEYANEISGNIIRNISSTAMESGINGGGGIELGNSGSTHDMSGSFNWIHDNRVISSKTGVRVEFGTKNTLVENNIIRDCFVLNGAGIYMGYTEKVFITGNQIFKNQSENFSGIYMFQGKEQNEARKGSPKDCEIYNNKIVENVNGTAIKIVEQESGNIIRDNIIYGNLFN